MTLARRLLIAPGMAAPVPLAFPVTSAPAGGWTQIPSAKALRYGTSTYFCYTNGSSGQVEMRVRPDGGPTGSAIGLRTYTADTHTAPGMIVDDVTHKLVVAYSDHNGSTMYVRTSTSSLDSDPTLANGFGSEVALGGAISTYPILVQRKAETNEPIYLFYRDLSSGSTAVLAYRKSSDAGATWTSQVPVFQNTGHLSYWKITTDGQWRIDFFVTSDAPPTASNVYHFYADNTDYHKTDGTVLAGSNPYPISALTLVYSGSPAWPTDAAWDGSCGRVVMNTSESSNTDSAFRYAHWSGSAWVNSTILASAGAGIVDPSPVASLDPSDPARCLLCRKVGSKFEVWKYATQDSGATWSGSSLTPGSAVDNLYPTGVYGHLSGTWGMFLSGTYTSDQSNSLAIIGVGP